MHSVKYNIFTPNICVRCAQTQIVWFIVKKQLTIPVLLSSLLLHKLLPILVTQGRYLLLMFPYDRGNYGCLLQQLSLRLSEYRLFVHSKVHSLDVLLSHLLLKDFHRSILYRLSVNLTACRRNYKFYKRCYMLVLKDFCRCHKVLKPSVCA